jgi:hypothetical protein
LPDPSTTQTLTLLEALVASADPQLWRRYCRLAMELEGRSVTDPVYAPGSVEWQRQQDRASAEGEPAHAEDAGRSRLARRGRQPPFAGAPSPFGAAMGKEFDAFLAQRRGPQALLAEIDTIEPQLIAGFEGACRSGRCRVTGFHDGARIEIAADWFGRMDLDLGRNAVVLSDGSEIAGIEVATGPSAATGAHGRERKAQAMLRRALLALWERGAFTAGTGNERVLALALRELGLSAADPPYGFKSAETVRKLRKTLKMSL